MTPGASRASVDAADASVAGDAAAAVAATGAAAAAPAAGTLEEFEEMSMEEVMIGKGDYYPGLVPLVYAYLEHIHCDRETFKRVDL